MLLATSVLSAWCVRVLVDQRTTLTGQPQEDFHESEQGGAVTRCAHIFCYTCLVDVINAEQRGDHDEEGADKKCKADQRPCPMCVVLRSASEHG